MEKVGFISGVQGWFNIHKSIDIIHHINKTKKEKSHNYPYRCRKLTFDKIHQPFVIKILNKVGIEGRYLYIIKAIQDKPKANIIFNVEKLKAFPLNSGT